MKLKIIDVFSGIGGFSIAGEWIGWETLIFCEQNKFCQKVLNKHWPDIKIHNNVKTLTLEIVKQEMITKYGYYDPNELILTAGVPCQPASVAGKRRGKDDDRWLWPEAIRLVGEIQPAIAFFENPLGILSLDNGKPFEEILSALEDKGYIIESHIVPACGVGAWHRRNRVWILAYSINSTNFPNRKESRKEKEIQGEYRSKGCSGMSDRANNEISSDDTNSHKGFSKQQKREIQTRRNTINNGSENDADSNMPGKRTSKNRVNEIGQKKKQKRNESQSEFNGYSEDVADSNDILLKGKLGSGGHKKEATASEGQNQQPRGRNAYRERIWDESGTSSEDVADSNSQRRCSRETDRKDAKDVGKQQRNKGSRRENFKSGLGGMVYGLPDWLDEPEGVPRVTTEKNNKKNRIEALGNSVVPQVVYEFYKAIDKVLNQ